MFRRADALAWLVTAAVLFSPGCARQYRWYHNPCECIPYEYCPVAPMPFTDYCGCPTPTASRYRTESFSENESSLSRPARDAKQNLASGRLDHEARSKVE
jgi:hypothetical protein